MICKKKGKRVYIHIKGLDKSFHLSYQSLLTDSNLALGALLGASFLFGQLNAAVA